MFQISLSWCHQTQTRKNSLSNSSFSGAQLKSTFWLMRFVRQSRAYLSHQLPRFPGLNIPLTKSVLIILMENHPVLLPNQCFPTTWLAPWESDGSLLSAWENQQGPPTTTTGPLWGLKRHHLGIPITYLWHTIWSQHLSKEEFGQTLLILRDNTRHRTTNILHTFDRKANHTKKKKKMYIELFEHTYTQILESAQESPPKTHSIQLSLDSQRNTQFKKKVNFYYFYWNTQQDVF